MPTWTKYQHKKLIEILKVNIILLSLKYSKHKILVSYSLGTSSFKYKRNGQTNQVLVGTIFVGGQYNAQRNLDRPILK